MAPINPAELGADDSDDRNLDETKEDEPNFDQKNSIDLKSDFGNENLSEDDEPNVSC